MRSRWAMGFLASVLFAWAVSFLFLDSLEIYRWDSQAHCYVQARDTVMTYRSEGNGRTYAGAHGVSRYPDIGNVREKKVAFWGDSFVEAFQVDDSEKMDSVFTQKCLSEGKGDTVGFSCGMSGNSSADYYFRIPRYERLVPSIIAHVIIITGTEDILPSEKTARCEFRANPVLELRENEIPLPFQDVKAVFQRCGLTFLWNAAYPLATGLRLQLLPQAAASGRNTAPTPARAIRPEEAWPFLLDKFRSATDAPVIFVYCPAVPSLSKGMVTFDDPNREIMKVFACECRKRGIGYIDMSRDFLCQFLKDNTFPRGFSNSRIAEGHFNATGHRLIAERVYRFLAVKAKG